MTVECIRNLMQIVWGGTCFDFSRVGRIWKEARSVFVAGTEAGSVIHGNLTYSQADVDSFKEKQASEVCQTNESCVAPCFMCSCLD